MGLGQDAEKAVRDLTGMWWPDADEDGLRRAAAAWTTLAGTIDDVCASANNSALAVIHNNSGPAVDAFTTFWDRYYYDDAGWLHDAAESCRNMANAFTQYADAVAQAKHQLEEKIAVVGGVLIAGTALAFFTGGLSEAAADGAAAGIVAAAGAIGVTVSETVATIAATVLTGAVFGSVEAATIDLAVAQPIKISFGDQNGINGTEILDAAETGGITGGAASGFGAGARALAESSDTLAPALNTLNTLPGRMLLGAGMATGQDAVFNDGNINPLDVTAGAIGGAAAPGGRASTDEVDPGPSTADRINALRVQGHAPGRHVDPPDDALQRRLGTTVTNPDGSPKLYTSASSNAGHVKSKDFIDPLTGTTVDGDTGGPHKCGPYATRYKDPADLVAVDDYMRQYIAENNGAAPPTSTPIADVLGPDGHLRFTGFYKNPANPDEYLPVDFEGGTIVAVYVPDGNGGYDLLTSYANPAPGKHP